MKHRIALGLAVSACVGVPLVVGGVAWASEGPQRQAASSEQQAPAASEPDLGGPARAAFWDAKYTYEQLLALAAEWKVDELEAKVQAGQRILANDTSEINAVVGAAGQGAGPAPVQAFFASGYSYDDAVELAEEWGTGTYDAKVRASGLIAAGQGSTIEALLAHR